MCIFGLFNSGKWKCDDLLAMVSKKIWIVFLVSLQCGLLAAKPSISYRLTMPEPQTHYFEVEMVLQNFNDKTLDIKMPVWAPGSYLIREFPKNVDVFDAYDENNQLLESYKTDKNTWHIEKGNSDKVIIKYNVYAFELSVRTSFLDMDHGYINGTSVFMFVDKYLDLPSRLEIIPFKEWKIVSTALPEIPNSKWNYQSEDYDQLVDCPIEIGNHKEIKFEAAGITHTIAMYGKGNYDEDRIKKDYTRLIEGLTKIFGQNPANNYVFIIHNLENGGGGLEHKNSTTLEVNRWTYAPEKNYKSFLGLSAHEYFHLWLVKRIRPVELGPFDYNKENYTDMLWVMEGFTSYYSQLILVQLGYLTESEFLSNLAESFTSQELSPGNTVQSVGMSSFDAWIKAYRPNENSSNTQVSYYQKGSILAALLDVLIISNSEGENNLGDALKYLYDEYYLKSGKGITDEDLKKALEKYARTNLDDFYEKYVYGTEEIDYENFFRNTGLKIKKVEVKSENKQLGIKVSTSNGQTTVKSVLKDSPGWKCGINADDELLAIDNFRITSNGSIDKILNNQNFGDTVEVIVSRQGILKKLSIVLEPINSFYYQISANVNGSKHQGKILDKWLNNK